MPLTDKLFKYDQHDKWSLKIIYISRILKDEHPVCCYTTVSDTFSRKEKHYGDNEVDIIVNPRGR